MDQAARPARFSRAVRIMHGALVAGLTLVGGVFFLLLRIQGQALGAAPTLASVLAGLSISLLAVAVAVLRRRVPERRPDQSPDAYWATVETRGAAIVLWALMEGAGLLAWIGYVLTGRAVPAAAAALAIAALILLGPSRLEGAA